MIKERKYTITIDLLRSYKENALRNAESLLVDARILLQNNRWAGSYFLGCVSIEETGKAFLAFNSVNRNLKNPAVQSIMKRDFENHITKIVMGLNTLLRKDGVDEKSIEYFLDLNFHLHAGREKSLYADINDDNSLTVPEDIVRPEVATDAIRLAEDSLRTMKEFFATNEPQKFTPSDDKFFVISKKKGFQKMMRTSDFWWFYIDLLKKLPYSTPDHLSIAASKYWDEHFSKGKLWGGKQTSNSNNSNDTNSTKKP